MRTIQKVLEKEKLKHMRCFDKLLILKVIRPGASRDCTSKNFPDRNIFAVVSDGVEECLHGEDEGWLCTNSKIPFYGTTGNCAFIIITLILYKLITDHSVK